MDVWPECTQPQKVFKLCKMENFSIYGRPAFKAFFAALKSSTMQISIPEAAQKLLEILCVKIVCGTMAEFTSNAGNMSDACLAIVAVRTSISVAASCKVASTLTATHMRLCVGVSDDRKSVYTYQYAEPCLAYAAMILTHSVGWKVLLDH